MAPAADDDEPMAASKEAKVASPESDMPPQVVSPETQATVVGQQPEEVP